MIVIIIISDSSKYNILCAKLPGASCAAGPNQHWHQYWRINRGPETGDWCGLCGGGHTPECQVI